MTGITAFSLADGERYADILTSVAAALAADDLPLAQRHLQPIAGEVWTGRLPLAGKQGPGSPEKVPRAVSDAMRAKVFLRDGFLCTYCGGRTIPRCVLVGISDVLPNDFAYHPNYRRGCIHPAFWALAPEADHTVAHSRGGSGDLTNLTTLHTVCNARKSDSLLSELPAVARIAASAGWDGLLDEYAGIVAMGEAHGHRHSVANYHARWMRNFGLQTGHVA